MDRKIRVGAVSYLNTKPLLYGIEHSLLMSDIELSIDYPSRIASMLLEDQIDVGLVPVAVIPKMKKYEIITDYCIGCDGPVASVCIFAESPIEQLDKVYLDYQSETSVHLAKILLRDYWNVHPALVQGNLHYTEQIKGRTGGLIIGDRALVQRNHSPYVYDLGEAWKQWTGLPFVFAAWLSNKQLDFNFIHSFNQANKEGLSNLSAVLESQVTDIFDLQAYYTRFISYTLDNSKISGLNKFLELIQPIL